MDKPEDKRSFYVFATAVLSVAAAGLISGTRPPPEHDGLNRSHTPPDAERALSYTELREGRRGKNASMYDDAFAWLRGLGPELTDEVAQSQADREAALAVRRTRRAYAGAPPVVPHPIQERKAAACLACHETGALVGNLRAPMMSHEKYTMCVQCHAPTRAEHEEVASRGGVGETNAFAGIHESGPGAIAWQGAPPTIPHQTFMRENCSSCHGRLGAHGLRTPHPAQTSCTQCHAPAATFDPAGPPRLDASIAERSAP